LFEPLAEWGWTYGKPYPSELDELDYIYLDPVEGTPVVWFNKNLVLKMNEVYPKDGHTQGFLNSKLAYDLHGTPSPKMFATKFHFHVPAEHSVNGKVVNAEMHINHNFEAGKLNGYLEGLFGIRFAYEDYDRDISQEATSLIYNFFDSLNLNGAFVDGSDQMMLNHVYFSDYMR